MTLLTRPSRLLLLTADAVSIEATVEGTISGQHQSEHVGRIRP